MDSAGEVRLICGRSRALCAWQWAEWKTNVGPCHSQWSSSVTLRDRERTGQELEHSVFTQVCVAACQLLWNNIESRLKAKLYVQTQEEESVLYKNGLVYYFLKAIQGWALPQKHAFLTTPALHSHTPTFPYLSMGNFPQLRWFRYACYERNYSRFGLTAWKWTHAAFKVFTGEELLNCNFK